MASMPLSLMTPKSKTNGGALLRWARERLGPGGVVGAIEQEARAPVDSLESSRPAGGRSGLG